MLPSGSFHYHRVGIGVYACFDSASDALSLPTTLNLPYRDTVFKLLVI